MRYIDSIERYLTEKVKELQVLSKQNERIADSVESDEVFLLFKSDQEKYEYCSNALIEVLGFLNSIKV